MKFLLTVVFLINAISVLNAQEKSEKVKTVEELITRYKSHHVTIREIHTRFGTPKDTIRYDRFILKGYSDRSLYFATAIIGYYDVFMIDIKTFDNELNFQGLKFSSKSSLADMARANMNLKDVYLIDAANESKTTANRLVFQFDTFQFISMPLSDKEFSKLSKLKDKNGRLKDHNLAFKAAKKIRPEFVWCYFAAEEYVPAIQEIKINDD